MNAPAIRAWYFSESSKLLRYGDAREIAIGVTHEVTGDLELCKRGLHASVKPLDALKYAPGAIVWRVELSGNVLTGADKLCASHRTYIAGGVDVTDTLRLFARQCALDVAHLWDMPEVVRRYLETGDESLSAAARDAASDAAWAAASDAARAAARAAAWAAARVAAWAAARDAAWAAARAAARDAAWAAQNTRLEAMLLEVVWGGK